MAKKTKGQVTGVPCPHCNRPNNFCDGISRREAEAQFKGMVDQGTVFPCDHCGKGMAFETTVQGPLLLVFRAVDA